MATRLQTKIVYMGTRGPFQDMMVFNLQTNFTFNVVLFDSVNLFADYVMKNGEYFLLICDGSLSAGQIRRAYEINKKRPQQIPFILIAKSTYVSEFHDLDLEFVDRDSALEKIESRVKNFFMENPLVKPSDYCPVNFRVLTAFEGLQVAAYIQLPSGRYLKIYQEEDNISEEDVIRYEKKGVEFLYLRQRAAQWILREVRTNFVRNMEKLEKGQKLSIISPPKEEEDPLNSIGPGNIDDVYAQAQLEDKDKEKSLQEIIMELQAEKQAQKALETPTIEITTSGLEAEDSTPVLEESDKVKKVYETLDGKFQLGENFQKDINRRVNKAVNIMKKNPSLKKLLEKLQLDRDPTRYFNNHINLLCRITCTLANLMQWNHESTLEKLIFVSYMHDITLVDAPHLASIQNLVEYAAVEKDLEDKEKKLYINHPKDIAAMIAGLEDAPVDSDKIIMQHHELPDKSGFPLQLSHQRILPLSALFIIAHDLVNYMLNDPEWSFDEFARKGKDKYIGPNFTKIIRRISKLDTPVS